MSRMIATVFGIGYLRPAPGTWGSLAAVFLAWGLVAAGGWPLLVVAILVSIVAGYVASERYAEEARNADPSEVVIDELAGQWIALLPVAIGISHAGSGFWALWPGVLTAFLAFRLFDIWKPGPIGWADRRGDPVGLMLDDILAGIAAAVVVMIGAGLAHGI